ncbi:MAG: NADPH-dependent FMN reductase [Chthoniobacterales bacterium]
MKIILLSGTNRPNSNTRKVTAELEGIYREIGNPAEVLDLADLPQEIFHPSSYAKKPESFARFSDAILASDGVHLVTPEYNGSIPGILKYFIDMLPFPESFEKRPIAFTGLAAGMWGALRPVEQLQLIFGYRLAHIFPARVFMPAVNNVLDEQGILNDPELRKRLRDQAQGFVEFVQKLKK